MPSISGLSFSVKFDLTSSPLLVITDTSTAPPAGFKAFMSITLPDGYNYTGNLISPDIPSAGSVFSTTLRLGSDGYVQNGTYIIVMTGHATGYDDTTFTRTFTISFPNPSVSIREDFDVFTPVLKLTDITNYTVSGYTTGTLTRSWSVSSVPTGTITGTGVILDLIYGGHYYDAYYNIIFSATSLYTHSTYSWFTVAKKYNKSYTTYARTPDTIATIIGLIDTLKYVQDSNGDCCCHDDFPYAQALLDHIIQKYLSGDTIGLSTDLSQLIALLHNNITPIYSPLNTIINTYNWSTIVPGGGSSIWGSINGTLSNQTDLQNALNAKQPNISLTTTGSSGAATFVSNVLNIPQYAGTVTSVGLSSTTSGVTIGSSPVTTNGVITVNISTASGSVTGLLSSTDWNTFNNKQSTVSLTTTGSSGAATFVGNVLNVPIYSISGLGGTPSSRTITINGVAFDLSADRTWTISEVDTLNSVTNRGNTTTNGITVGSSTVLGSTTAQLFIRPVTNNNSEILFQNAGYGTAKWTIRATASVDGISGDLTFQRNNSTFPVTIKASENVLIGDTTDPGYKIYVKAQYAAYFKTPNTYAFADGGVYIFTLVWGRPYATALLVGNFQLSAFDSEIHMGNVNSGVRFKQESSTSSQMYVIGIPTIIFGANQGPSNVSQMLFGVNDIAEYTTGGTYPNATDNYYHLTTAITSSLYNRRRFQLSAYDLRFITGNTGSEAVRISETGTVKVINLSGTGTRMVVADSTGLLSTQSIPTGTGTAITRSINNISSNTTAGSTAYTDYIYFVTGNTTVTLPTAVSNTNIYTIKNTGTGTVTVATTSSQNIDDNTTFSITIKNYTIDVISDGTNWKII